MFVKDSASIAYRLDGLMLKLELESFKDRSCTFRLSTFYLCHLARTPDTQRKKESVFLYEFGVCVCVCVCVVRRETERKGERERTGREGGREGGSARLDILEARHSFHFRQYILNLFVFRSLVAAFRLRALCALLWRKMNHLPHL